MILDEGVFALLALALLAYCVFDVIRTDASLVQNLPKMVWLLLVIFLGPLGCIAWLLLGRPSRASFRLTAAETFPTPPAALPEQQPSEEEFRRRREEALRRYEADQQRDADLKRREEELRRREEELERRQAPPSDEGREP